MTKTQEKMVELFIQAYTTESCGDCRTCPFRKLDGDCILWDVESVLTENARDEYHEIWNAVKEDD